ncbi:MAG: hypothetical protein JW952_03895 [Candidatus Eisenbacteria bacterium]|nr:hypothetical protein [Candidatus Eisenbacteria bacterium]
MSSDTKGHDTAARSGDMIRVYVDGKPIIIARAFSVRHAILAHDEDALAEVISGEAYVADARGVEVDLDGALFDGMRLYLKSTEAE